MIQNIEKRELTLKCADLLAKTYVELGQKSQADTIVALSQVLAADLHKDFKNLYFNDIENAFRNGVRKSDEFHLSVKTYYRWIYRWRSIIWDATYQVETQGANPKQVPNYREKPKLLTHKNQKPC